MTDLNDQKDRHLDVALGKHFGGASPPDLSGVIIERVASTAERAGRADKRRSPRRFLLLRGRVAGISAVSTVGSPDVGEAQDRGGSVFSMNALRRKWALATACVAAVVAGLMLVLPGSGSTTSPDSSLARIGLESAKRENAKGEIERSKDGIETEHLLNTNRKEQIAMNGNVKKWSLGFCGSVLMVTGSAVVDGSTAFAKNSGDATSIITTEDGSTLLATEGFTSELFTTSDTDADGFLDVSEFCDSPELLFILDANHDNLLDETEFSSFEVRGW